MLEPQSLNWFESSNGLDNSFNPSNLRMREEYGLKLLNIRRQAEKIKEFPLILERDFSDV